MDIFDIVKNFSYIYYIDKNRRRASVVKKFITKENKQWQKEK